MKTIYIYCEGPTEESFINTVLYPYFFALGIYVRPIVCETRRDANRKYRGGVSRYAKIKSELMILCKSHPHEYVTTMFDYYAMPSDTPGIADATTDIFERINKIESIINEDIGERNCKFHFMLHEFEGILFSKPETFSLIAGDEVVTAVQRIREEFETYQQFSRNRAVKKTGGAEPRICKNQKWNTAFRCYGDPYNHETMPTLQKMDSRHGSMVNYQNDYDTKGNATV